MEAVCEQKDHARCIRVKWANQFRPVPSRLVSSRLARSPDEGDAEL